MRALFLLLLFSSAAAVHAQAPRTVLTLPQALALAEDANPAVRTTRATIAAAEGESRQAAALFRENPDLTVEQTQRKVADANGIGTSFRESAVGLSQKFEIAGQPGYRRDAASYALSAAQADVTAARARVHAEVEGAFAHALLLQRRLAAEERNLRLVEDASAAGGKRVAAGEDTRLDGNLALVESERARNQLAAVREQLLAARARLAALLQLPAADFPEVAGDIPEHLPAWRIDDLIARAAQRPDLVVLQQKEAAAQKRLDLERASAWPDVTVGLNSSREGPPELRERATTLTFSVPLPLFTRNQAGIGRAITERDQAQVQRQVAVRDGEAAVREQWQRLANLDARLSRLRDSVLARLDENLSLSTKAYRAGEIGIIQLVLVNRQALDARRDYLDALGEFTQARISLELAAGLHASSESKP